MQEACKEKKWVSAASYSLLYYYGTSAPHRDPLMGLLACADVLFSFV